jgi:hypothetical protein
MLLETSSSGMPQRFFFSLTTLLDDICRFSQYFYEAGLFLCRYIQLYNVLLVIQISYTFFISFISYFHLRLITGTFIFSRHFLVLRDCCSMSNTQKLILFTRNRQYRGTRLRTDVKYICFFQSFCFHGNFQIV